MTDLMVRAELDRLVELEATVDRGLTTFVDVGNALVEIRDARLYRANYGTFEDYCQLRWGFTYQRAHQMIQAASVVSTIVESGLPAPANEGQARELARLPEDQRAQVWEKALAESDGKPTAAAIRQAAEPERLPGEEPLPFDEFPADLADPFEQLAEPRRADPIWSTEEYTLLEELRAGRTVVVSLRGQHDNLIAWAEREGKYVRIDRRSEWGNPFELPADGDRATVIANYADHYLPNKPSLLAKLDTLRGKALGCWCAPEACHGDVLAEALEQ